MRWMRTWFAAIDLVRRMVLNLAFLGVLGWLLVSVLGREGLVAPDAGILRLHPVGALVEGIEVPNAASWLRPVPPSDQVPVHQAVRLLAQAGKDARITGLLLELDDLAPSPMAELDVLRRAVLRFRNSGKPVVALAGHMDQGQYFLASAADRIVLRPLGSIDFKGFGVYRHYFREALARWRIDVEEVHVGRFKSAVEPLTRDAMSDDARRANARWLSRLWRQYKRAIYEQRKLTGDPIQQLADHPLPAMRQAQGDMAHWLQRAGFVDVVGGQAEARAALATLMGTQVDSLPPFIDQDRYRGMMHEDQPPAGAARIGIILADGAILPGEQPAGTIGAATLSRRIRQAANDDRYAALVIRLNSPGGDALASEHIRQAVLAAKRKKPVVVSMAAVAASGGYWMASAADEIWAEPATLTGSIGVFGVLVRIPRLLEQWHVHHDGVGTARMSAAMLSSRPLPPEMRASIEVRLQHVYDRFLDVVAEGRGQPRAAIAKAAEGRVWVSEDALARHLIDHVGGLRAAVAAAARRAKVHAFSSEWIMPRQGWRERLVAVLLGGLATSLGVDSTWIARDDIANALRVVQTLLRQQPAILALWPARCVF
ncbi:MAG: signal peptide peptidase SppA [Zetaproteobacteria bacterium]|nr:MAG: signal peptide peptidase SppA [Zetaproteobacteria bacterium]